MMGEQTLSPISCPSLFVLRARGIGGQGQPFGDTLASIFLQKPLYQKSNPLASHCVLSRLHRPRRSLICECSGIGNYPGNHQ